MARKKSAAAKAREADGGPHPKDIAETKTAVLAFDSDSDAEIGAGPAKSSRKRKASEDVESSEEPSFKINEEYAKRFEHNKKREELHRLEEKYGKSATSKRRRTDNSDDDEDDSLASDESSSSSEDEDEIGELVTRDIDAQIQATINAIRSKDPRVYDTDSKFFSNEGTEGVGADIPKEKTMTLKQYHQKNILEGYTGDGDDTNEPPRTYVEEQEYLKRTVVGEMHAAVGGSDDEDEAGFLIRKEKTGVDEEDDTPTVALPENPEEDPEGFLSAFFSSKAWVPKDAGNNVAFESSDSEDEDLREEFEQAYNMRFEDPKLADRSKIITHARDVAKNKSLRREDTSRRKKARDEKKEREIREKEEREAEKNRLRKLRVEELEKKLKLVQEAGGLEAGDGEVTLDDKWKKLLDDAWEGDETWEKRMGEIFDDGYYEGKEDLKDEGKKSKKPKKPSWDDDIDIKDLVPDFEDEEVEASEEDGGVPLAESEEPVSSSKPAKPKKSAKKDKRADRILRAQIESYVDDKLPVSLPGSSKQSSSTFRYREVTPESFQLTPTDILFAGDKQLNQYAGLKKLAAFRDDSQKAKDRKRYAKNKGFKLWEWRKEVFGKPELRWEDLNGKGDARKEKISKKKVSKKSDEVTEPAESEKKKKKRRRKNKGEKEAATAES